MKNLFLFFAIFLFFSFKANTQEVNMLLKLEHGEVEIKLFPDVAPKHVERFTNLVKNKKYDGVVFHRVIDGFMAQTGDVKYGNSLDKNYVKILKSYGYVLRRRWKNCSGGKRKKNT